MEECSTSSLPQCKYSQDNAVEFTIIFLKTFAKTALLVGPILLCLALSIALLGLIIGRKEKWSISDSLYYAFITASTVGYGDYHPRHRKTKFAAIAIAFIGIILTGIMVAVGLKSVEIALNREYDVKQIMKTISETPSADSVPPTIPEN